MIDWDFDEDPFFDIKILNKKFFYGGAVICIGIILYLGIHEFLFFILDSWGGYDEYGEWNSTKSGLASTIALVSIFYIVSYVDKYYKLKDKLKKTN